MLDLFEIQAAEFGPAGTDDECVYTFGSGVWGFTIMNAAVQLQLGFWNGDRVISAHAGALGEQVLSQAKGRRTSYGICVRLEGQAKDSDILVFDRVDQG